MAPPFLAGFDLATVTGCCDGLAGRIGAAVAGRPRLWTWDLRDGGEGRPARLACLDGFIRAYLAEQEIHAVFYEAPLFYPVGLKIGMTEESLSFLRMAIGIVEVACHRAGVPVSAVNVQRARRLLLGAEPAKGKGKALVLERVRDLGLEPASDNESDAFAVWLAGAADLVPGAALAASPLFGPAR